MLRLIVPGFVGTTRRITSRPFEHQVPAARRAQVMDLLRKRLTDAGLEVVSVHSAYPTLEDIFVTMTRKADDKAGLF